jgi:hypothetical protein
MFHVPINNALLQEIQDEAHSLSCQINEMNGKIIKRLSTVCYLAYDSCLKKHSLHTKFTLTLFPKSAQNLTRVLILY